MTEKESQSNVQLSTTDGFRYLNFVPPVPSKKLFGMPYPQTTLPSGEEHAWTPTSINSVDGDTVSAGWMMEAFTGADETFVEYAQKLAEHIGGTVLNADNYVGRFHE